MKILIKCAALVTAAVILGSCGGGGGSGSTTTPTAPAPVTNSAPVLANANSDQNAQVGTAFNYDATQAGTTFSDANGDVLTYAVTFSPAAQGLTNSSGIISGTPTTNGTVSVTITARDNNGGQASDSFDITISEAATASDKPNIIFIISDDQGLDASEQYSLSTDVPNTPNLTALANGGVIFDNAWVRPTCSPTRAALMTGKHSLRTNVFSPGDDLPVSETILQSYLKSQAESSEYANAVIGKWHLGGGRTGPGDFGVEHFAGILTGGVSDYFDWTLNVNGTNTNSTNYVTTELTDQAINWTESQTAPWLLWLSYNAPHDPFHLPPASLHSRNLSGTAADIAANPRSYYLAAIEAMDSEFGRLWNSLSAAEQANTVVIYLGDNGTPGRVIDRAALPNGSKGSLFQAGVAAPMFVSGAGVSRAGEREDALINDVDFFATIAELTGADLPAYHNGRSFAPLLTRAGTGERDYAYSEDSSGFTIRGERYKLVEDAGGNQNLYDLTAVPLESADLLAGAADVSGILAELEAAAAEVRDREDISGTKFTNLSSLCTDYAGSYQAVAHDVGRDLTLPASIDITAGATQCTISSNSVPNHRFNDGAGFPNTTGAVAESFSFPINPVAAASPTELTINRDNAILLNGVKVDVLAAACFGVGDERTGCNNVNQPWRFDPMHAPNGFNVDSNNAHTQPDGAYHYHGPPPLTNGGAATPSGVIGFAADGFPIFGPWFDDGTAIRRAVPSYQLKAGNRPSGANDPGGTYDGQFRDDYEYSAGLGDLDACNGMTRDGQYGYYITDGFPYIVGCFTGTPDPSFNK